MGTGSRVRMNGLTRFLTSTALLAVTLTGLEVGGALAGGAVATAATVDDPAPPDGVTTPGDPDSTGNAEPVPDPADEPPPPGMTRFELPPGEEDAPEPGVPAEPAPEEAAPVEPAPEEPLPLQAVPVAPMPGTGPAILKPGMKGRQVQKLQVRLQRVGTLKIPVTGVYAKQTTAAVKRFQARMYFVRSGKVDEATLRALYEKAGKVGRKAIAAGENRPYGSELAASCLTGNVVCVDKTGRTVRWVVDGTVRMTLDARFGGYRTETREGVFQIYWKSRDHVSKLYDSSMPFAMFFNGGQAVHYSPDFASQGYNGASHGCVNTRQYGKMRRLFDLASVGDRVVVYRSRPIKG